MEIDKHLYNIDSQQDIIERTQYISQLSEQKLNEVQKQIIQRVDKFNPDDSQSMEEIREGLRLYEQLMINNTFNQITLHDGSFICSLAFYLSAEKLTQCLARGIQLIGHQYLTLQQKTYAQSINLFKALLEVYESINEQYYQKMTLLMLKMVVQNPELLTVINHKYYFLQCLIQMVNQQQNTQKLAQYFVQLRKLYSTKNTLLFHSTDFQILIDILLRTLINQNQSDIIQQTLKLYLILGDNPILAKDHYRVQEFHSALKEKLNFIEQDQIGSNLKNIIHEILNSQ